MQNKTKNDYAVWLRIEVWELSTKKNTFLAAFNPPPQALTDIWAKLSFSFSVNNICFWNEKGLKRMILEEKRINLNFEKF